MAAWYLARCSSQRRRSRRWQPRSRRVRSAHRPSSQMPARPTCSATLPFGRPATARRGVAVKQPAVGVNSLVVLLVELIEDALILVIDYPADRPDKGLSRTAGDLRRRSLSRRSPARAAVVSSMSFRLVTGVEPTLHEAEDCGKKSVSGDSSLSSFTSASIALLQSASVAWRSDCSRIQRSIQAPRQAADLLGVPDGTPQAALAPLRQAASSQATRSPRDAPRREYAPRRCGRTRKALAVRKCHEKLNAVLLLLARTMSPNRERGADGLPRNLAAESNRPACFGGCSWPARRLRGRRFARPASAVPRRGGAQAGGDSSSARRRRANWSEPSCSMSLAIAAGSEAGAASSA